MIHMSDMKKGKIVDINSAPHVVVAIEVKTPSARGASTLYKTRFKNLLTGQKINQSLKGDDTFNEIDCLRCPLQYLFAEGDKVTFMNLDDYSQYELFKADLEDELKFIQEGAEDIIGLVSNQNLLTIQLPSTVTLTIVECPPAMKTASASARTKPATLETGLVVQVPEYIEQGEQVIVNTETVEFVSRA